MNESHVRNVVEAALLAAGKSLQVAELTQLFDEGAQPTAEDIRAALETLTNEYGNRGIEIKETAAGFRIQVRRELANEISRLWPERPPRYSRALLETLALIAYRQPITRAEIEAVRGVAVNPNIVKTIIERNWVRVVGHRDVPGRPELLGTTRDFLDYFGLRNLDDLPPLAQLKAMSDINLQLELSGAGVGAQDGTSAESANGAAANAIGQGAGEAGAVAAVALSADDDAAADDDNAAEVGEEQVDRTLTADAAHATDGTAAGSAAAGTIATDDVSTHDDGEQAQGAHIDEQDDQSDQSDQGEDDELSADGHGSREMVAAPPGHDD
jgi:segregation and condensation protein B